MVIPHPRPGKTFTGIITAGTAALHVCETERVFGGAPEGGEIDHIRYRCFGLAPESQCPDDKYRKTIQRDERRRYGHGGKRHDPVKRPLTEMSSEKDSGALEEKYQCENDNDRKHGDRRHRKRVPFE